MVYWMQKDVLATVAVMVVKLPIIRNNRNVSQLLHESDVLDFKKAREIDVRFLICVLSLPSLAQ